MAILVYWSVKSSDSSCIVSFSSVVLGPEKLPVFPEHFCWSKETLQIKKLSLLDWLEVFFKGIEVLGNSLAKKIQQIWMYQLQC